MQEKSLYERYGFRGLVTDYIYKMYFNYNYTPQTDDISMILFERFYVTPWIRRKANMRPKYNLKECQSKLGENLTKISKKLDGDNYKVNDELYELMDVFRDMNSKKFFILRIF